MTSNQGLVLNPRTSVHLARKVWHSGTGALGIGIYNYSGWDALFLGQVLIGIAVFAFIFEWLRLRVEPLNRVFCRLAAPLMRDTELNAPTGFAFYALGVGLTLIFFDRDVAMLACCYLVFADPVASLVGVKIGKTKIWNGRSLEGTFAFFTIALFINYYFYHLGFFQDVKNFALFSIITAISAAISEVVCHGKYLDDNMVIPLVAGVIITVSALLF
jgi:dolichol kinase